MKAAIVYRSSTGTTRRFAEEIGAHLRTLGVETVVASVGEADPAAVAGADVVLLGCWTSGLFVVLQHPDQPWIAFARALPPLTGKKVGLFTTYKLLTGSMFGKMREELADRAGAIGLELKSRDGTLSEANRSTLARFVAD
ncbi:MAG TPA: flavodoxin domain-containing protein [Candidatus Limnocylindrales bacterium]